MSGLALAVVSATMVIGIVLALWNVTRPTPASLDGHAASRIERIMLDDQTITLDVLDRVDMRYDADRRNALAALASLRREWAEALLKEIENANHN